MLSRWWKQRRDTIRNDHQNLHNISLHIATEVLFVPGGGIMAPQRFG